MFGNGRQLEVWTSSHYCLETGLIPRCFVTKAISQFFLYPFKKVLLQLSILSQLLKAAVFLTGHRIIMSLQIPAYNLYVAILFGIGISLSPVVNLLSFINLYKKVLYKVYILEAKFLSHINSVCAGMMGRTRQCCCPTAIDCRVTALNK